MSSNEDHGGAAAATLSSKNMNKNVLNNLLSIW
jgi:hypothetical protein